MKNSSEVGRCIDSSYDRYGYVLRPRRHGEYELPPLPEFPRLPPLEQTEPWHLAMRVAALVKYAQDMSPFFREKYGGLRLPATASTPDEILEYVPPLTRHELVAITNQYGKIKNPLFTREPFGTDYNTGGTTDHKAGIIFETAEQNYVLENMSELLKYIYSPGDRVLIATQQYPMWGGYNLNLLMWRSLGYVRVLPVGAGANIKELINVFSEYQPTVMAGLAASIMSIFDRVSEVNPDLLASLRIIQFAGMPMSEEMKKAIKKYLQAIRFVSHYTASESWCTALGIDPNYPNYLYLSNNAVVRVVDSNFMPVPDGQVGQLLITRVYETLLPLINYTIGDAGRIVPYEEYPSEERLFPNARVIELTGRYSKKEFILGGLKADVDALLKLICLKTNATHAQIIKISDNKFEIRVHGDNLSIPTDNPAKLQQLIKEILSDYFKYYPVSSRVEEDDYLSKAGVEVYMKHVYDYKDLFMSELGKPLSLVDLSQLADDS